MICSVILIFSNSEYMEMFLQVSFYGGSVQDTGGGGTAGCGFDFQGNRFFWNRRRHNLSKMTRLHMKRALHSAAIHVKNKLRLASSE